MTNSISYTGEERQPVVLGVSLVFVILSLAAVSLRFYSRLISKVGLWYDDWAIFIALVRWPSIIEAFITELTKHGYSL